MQMANVLLRQNVLCFGGILIVLALMNTGGGRASAEIHRPKNVQVSLRAKWPGTPLLLEAGELLSKEWKDLYWKFTDAWLHSEGESSSDDSAPMSAKGCLQKIIKCGRSLLNEPLASIFEFSLILRSSSPKLVVYRQLAEESLSSFLPGGLEIKSNTEGPVQGEISRNVSYQSLPAGMQVETSWEKCCWVDTGRTLLFNVSELQMWLDKLEGLDGPLDKQPELFDFDHVFLEGKMRSPAVVLYGALGTNCFKEFHIALAEASKKEQVKYVARPIMQPGCKDMAGKCGSVGVEDALVFGGYGVELALKNMEYKAMDDSAVKEGISLDDPKIEDLTQEVRGFIFSKLLERKPELTAEIMAFRHYLQSSTASETLDIWELKDLGHQSVQKIVQASDSLQSMQEISHNFPSLVSSLSRMKLNMSIKDEVTANQRMVPPGKSLMAVNGVLLNIDDIDLYMLFDHVHEELSVADQFSEMKVPHSYINKLLSMSTPLEPDSFRFDFRSDHVHYLNNLEEDAMYKRWRSNLHEILLPVFPGQLHYIRKNLFHAVYVFDPATLCGLELVDTIMSMYENSFPMRFGVIFYSSRLLKMIEDIGGDVPMVQSEDDEIDVSSLIISLFCYIKDNDGVQMAFHFLYNLKRLTHSDGIFEESLEVHYVEEAFIDTLLPRAGAPPHDILQSLEKEQTLRRKAEESSIFVYKLGLSVLKCCFLMNGLVREPTEDGAITAMNEEMRRIQEQVYYGHITSRTDVLEKLLSESCYHRYNPQITGDGSSRRFISLSELFAEREHIFNQICFLHSPGTGDHLKPISHLVFANVISREGLKLLREGIHYLLRAAKKARIGVVFYANNVDISYLIFVRTFQISASILSHYEKTLEFLLEVCFFFEEKSSLIATVATEAGEVFVEKISELAGANGLPSHIYRSALSNISSDVLERHLDKVSRLFLSKLELESSANAVITNGRVIIVNNCTFLADDFGLLERVEFEQRIKHVVRIVEEIEWQDVDLDSITSEFMSDLVMWISSSLSTRGRGSDSAHFEILNAKHSAIVLNKGNSCIHIDAVLDPLSQTGQRLVPLLRMLVNYVQPSMRIVLNPVSSLADLPLKNYYRFVLPSFDDFSSVDYSVSGPKAFFANMPLSKTLTMNLDVPEPWLVEPVVAVHDLDNILLEKLRDVKTLLAVFELEAVVLTGYCSEKDHDPPRGLQLILGTKLQPHLVDTIVMANLGYWQMKAFPGVWYLQLAPGRSSELYYLRETGGGDSPTSLTKRIIVKDLRGEVVPLEAVKRKGKEHEHLLTSSPEIDDTPGKENGNLKGWNSHLFKWASSLIRSKEQMKRRQEDHAKSGRHGKEINIFSVASGHLYERFLKIMILSVLKNTRRPVKFWFIKNYLSPQFKDVIPHMAKEYGFDYELITYKWPTWLHKQKEKQRVIWAYKILFLDVIFPLYLKKVIFVDADQVVRTDMGELFDMDIKGRPLAYTPFCDNNKEMDGYRFWRQGFWKEHLRGKPYHISALYVVDLARFRQTAAGDHLRVIYETLSKDPNSLANLDQDLPNYAQHSVPIFSLPQEWLWCESWCGNSTKSKAKTIDLCNNPMTKEPKLQGAKRILPEWLNLDMEARQFTSRILGYEAEIQEPALYTSQTGVSVATNVQEDRAEL